MDVPRQKSLEEAVRLNSTERDYLSGPHIEQRQRNLEKNPKKLLSIYPLQNLIIS